MGTVVVRSSIVVIALSLAAGCATYQKNSYVALVDPSHPELAASPAEPKYRVVNDMAAESQAMYGRGYAMLGYSQFVSPQSPLFAKTNSLKWGRTLPASVVLEKKPAQYNRVSVPGRLDNFVYLITFWARRKVPEPGFLVDDLPSDVLKIMGEENNVVLVHAVLDESPAAEAGLRAGDALLALNGARVTSVKDLLKDMRRYTGQRVRLTVSRNGAEQTIQLRLDEQAFAALRDAEQRGNRQDAAGDVAFRDQPWLKTRATDWSGLADAIKGLQDLGHQIEEQERVKRERAEAQYQQQLAYYESMRRARERERERSRSTTGPPDPRTMSARDYQSAVSAWRQAYEKESLRQRNQAMDIWMSNAPNIYGQLFRFPRPRAF